MPLPKIETPTYTLELPSTGEQLEFRPYLVKEEKILMLAQESKDDKQILNAMCQVIQNCTFGKIDVKTLTNVDFQYIFLQLRIRSVGESTKFSMECEKTGNSNTVEVDLRNAYVKQPEKEIDDIVKITDTVGIKLRKGSLLQLANTILVENDITDSLDNMIKSVVESIYDEEDLYPIETISAEDFTEFIDSLTHAQLEHISEYIENEPQLLLDVEFVDKESGHVNKRTVKGSDSFFL
tara:strand:+ start:649 stop:1359 length:711 start_codon:yes stop_codon:yes gene_type:complete